MGIREGYEEGQEEEEKAEPEEEAVTVSDLRCSILQSLEPLKSLILSGWASYWQLFFKAPSFRKTRQLFRQRCLCILKRQALPLIVLLTRLPISAQFGFEPRSLAGHRTKQLLRFQAFPVAHLVTVAASLHLIRNTTRTRFK